MNLAATRYQPIPGPKGLEHLQIMNLAATYTNAAVSELAETYGEVFVFGFGPIRFHWLCGPEALRFVLQEQADAFTLKRAYSFLGTIGGDTALITSDEPEHLVRRRLVQPAFHGKRIASWLERISERNHRFLDGLEDGSSLDFYATIRPHMLRTVSELLLGDTLERRPTLLKNIAMMMDFANSPFLAQQFKLNVPPLPWWRFVRAKAQVDRDLYSEISRRKKREPSEDILGMLQAVCDEEGNVLSDVELRDQAVSLVSAGFDTTSAGLAWALYLLLENLHILEQLRESLASCTNLKDVLSLPLLEAVVKETLRLYPTAPAGLRETARDVVYKNFLIPEGSLLAYSIYVTHRQESSFKDALSFKPERWFRGPKPDTFAYLPFGYGARYCIGAQLATTLIKLTLADLLQKFEIRPAWTSPVQETGNTVQPKGGLPITLEPRRV